MSKTVRLLSIDGGGIRGVIPATVLQKLEELTGQRPGEMFDMIAGTSTGGVMALLATKRGTSGETPFYSAKDIVNLYVQDGKDLFQPDSRFKPGADVPMYDGAAVEATLERYLNAGERAELRDACTEVLVTSYDTAKRKPYFFTRDAARYLSVDNFYMADVAQATSAFPGFFPPVEIKSVDGRVSRQLIDGGFVAANPAALLLARAMKLHGRGARYVLVSLGTGDYVTPLDWNKFGGAGAPTWNSVLADLLFDGSNHGIDGEVMQMLGTHSYYRFQVELTASTEFLGNVQPENITALQTIAESMLGEPDNVDRLQELAKDLQQTVKAVG